MARIVTCCVIRGVAHITYRALDSKLCTYLIEFFAVFIDVGEHRGVYTDLSAFLRDGGVELPSSCGHVVVVWWTYWVQNMGADASVSVVDGGTSRKGHVMVCWNHVPGE